MPEFKTVKEAAEYIDRKYDDVIVEYDPKFNCIDLERTGTGDYLGCLFDLKDVERFIEINEK